MNPSSSLRRAARAGVTALACLGLLGLNLFAQSTGTLTGRVQDSAAGQSLEKARVTIAGTNREAFTDAFGEYRFTDLPPGAVTLNVF